MKEFFFVGYRVDQFMHQDLLIESINSLMNFFIKTRFSKISMEEANNESREINENNKDIEFKRG